MYYRVLFEVHGVLWVDFVSVLFTMVVATLLFRCHPLRDCHFQFLFWLDDECPLRSNISCMSYTSVSTTSNILQELHDSGLFVVVRFFMASFIQFMLS